MLGFTVSTICVLKPFLRRASSPLTQYGCIKGELSPIGADLTLPPLWQMTIVRGGGPWDNNPVDINNVTDADFDDGAWDIEATGEFFGTPADFELVCDWWGFCQLEDVDLA
jgi:hypothetical protein